MTISLLDRRALGGSGASEQHAKPLLDKVDEIATALNSAGIGDSSIDAADVDIADTAEVFTGTTVETVAKELYDLIDGHIDDTTAAHAASAVSYTDESGLLGSTVQAAINAMGPLFLQLLHGMYLLEFVGAAAAGNIALTTAVKTAGVTPREGDKIVLMIGYVTASKVWIAVPTVGTDFEESLITDTTVKVQQLAAGDLSANTYVALVAPGFPAAT